MKKPRKPIRILIAAPFFIAGFFFILAYWSRSTNLYPYEGPIAFLKQLYNFLIAGVLFAIGNDFVKWEAPWSKAKGSDEEKRS
jgi:uncharacterized membrane protein YadS